MLGKEMSEEICLEKHSHDSGRKCINAFPIQAISLDCGTNAKRCWIQGTKLVIWA